MSKKPHDERTGKKEGKGNNDDEQGEGKWKKPGGRKGQRGVRSQMPREPEVDMRRVRIPPHKYSQLKNNWPKIVAPIIQHLKLQIR